MKENHTPHEYICAVDAGGTFTDCVLVDETGTVTTAKASSTDDVVSGFFDSIDQAAEKLGYDLAEVLANTVRLAHGTTVSTNMVVEDDGATTGLLTTAGHEDAVRMMRGRGRVTGEPPKNVFRVGDVNKPDPIVPKHLIRGVTERIDANGDVIVELDEAQVRETVREISPHVDALAISLLWSFANPAHEQRIREIVAEEAPDVYTSCSHEISPSLGEYERTVATCINAIVGPGTTAYLQELGEQLSSLEFDAPFVIMQCSGGTATRGLAREEPVRLIGSGPVGGLHASERLVADEKEGNVIVTDMGGTSFEVGLIEDGSSLIQDQTIVGSYVYNISKLDIKSIGAGGGSIVQVDDQGTRLQVGPESAGANPGPACYGRGGGQPTVTDANVLLGYIDPDAQIGEELTPSESLAFEAMEPLADRLGMSVRQTARGVYDIVNTKMANLIQSEVIGRGYDPRDFDIVSYGGAGPLHAAAYSDQLGASSVVVPGEISPVWSAYGVSQSDIKYELKEELSLLEPFDPAELQAVFDRLEEDGRQLLLESEVEPDGAVYNRIVKMRYEGQVHELNVEMPSGSIDDDTIDLLRDRFERQYEKRYSAASRLPDARIEIVTLRSEPTGIVDKFERERSPEESETPPDDARISSREVYVSEQQPAYEVPVYDGTQLRPGNHIAGPTIIDLNNTSIVINDGQTVEMTNHYDFNITLKQ